MTDVAVLTRIARLLEPLIADPAIQGRLRAAWGGLRKPERDPDQRRMQELNQVIEQGRRRQDDALGLLVDGEITRERYRCFLEREQAEIDAARRELREIQAATTVPSLPAWDTVRHDLGTWRAALSSLDIQAKRAAVARLIVKVVPEKIGYGKHAPRIAWTPLGAALRELGAVISRA